MTASGLLALALLAAPADDPTRTRTPAASIVDPRVALVESQLAGRLEAALAETERLLATEPELARRIGLHYLRGRLLDRLDHGRDASNAYLTAISSHPGLALYSYYRLAQEHERLGHPEMAAGLIANVVGSGQPFAEMRAAVEMLRRSLAAGGDCRVLGGVRETRFEARVRRELALARAECALRDGEPVRAAEMVAALLSETREDDIAYQAAYLAADQLLGKAGPSFTLAVGMTLHEHRDFARSSTLLDRALSQAGPLPAVLDGATFSHHYARQRNDFWLGDYRAAAKGFAALAERAASAEKKADALYQEGRCHELLGDANRASAAFRRAYLAGPTTEWGPLGLLSALRVEWRAGAEPAALEAFSLLSTLAHGRDQAARGALFLSASDLVKGRADRAGAWLATAESLAPDLESEPAYWRGRRAELTGEREKAVLAYLEVLRRDAYQPFAVAARERLDAPALAATARDVGLRLAASERTDGLYAGWLLLGDRHPRSQALMTALAQRLAQDPALMPFVKEVAVPVGSWPLWATPPSRPEEVLLALGLFEEGAPAVARAFPTSSPVLALTGSRHLAAAGKTREALRVAEILGDRLPRATPQRLWIRPYRELLYPLPYRELLQAETAKRSVEPWLLAAIIREESRFDPRALSDASARGLTQFTQQTAQRFAEPIGLGTVEVADLYRPEVAIALGAAYLGDLGKQFTGSDAAVVAAYNAGEDQARLWQRYCVSAEPAEFYTKVAFRQTRGYLNKVLTSRAHYREIYARDAAGYGVPK